MSGGSDPRSSRARRRDIASGRLVPGIRRAHRMAPMGSVPYRSACSTFFAIHSRVQPGRPPAHSHSSAAASSGGNSNPRTSRHAADRVALSLPARFRALEWRRDIAGHVGSRRLARCRVGPSGRPSRPQRTCQPTWPKPREVVAVLSPVAGLLILGAARVDRPGAITRSAVAAYVDLHSAVAGVDPRAIRYADAGMLVIEVVATCRRDLPGVYGRRMTAHSIAGRESMSTTTTPDTAPVTIAMFRRAQRTSTKESRPRFAGGTGPSATKQSASCRHASRRGAVPG